MKTFNGFLALKSELLQISIDEHMRQLYVLEDERQKREEEELINTRTTTMKTIKERAIDSVHKNYNCDGEYPCERIGDCEMCGGCNTPYDCCECAAGDYMEGYLSGATEQEAITKQNMIEKAHRELYELMKCLSEAYHIPSESVNRHIEIFCKAMEL